MNAFLRLVAWMLALVMVALPVVAVINGWIGAERWPLRTLRVVGDLQRVDDAALRAAVRPHVQRGFFAVRLADAQTAVAKLAWVDEAEVRKQWPDVLIVRVVEHRPFAWWGNDRVLSERGKIFPAGGVAVPKGLPRFEGPESANVDLVAFYNEARAMFAPVGIDIVALRIDTRGSRSMTLSTGAELLLGRDDARLRLARFARLLPQLQAQNARVLARADLRYTNGFALTWRAAAQQGGNEESKQPGTEHRQPVIAAARDRWPMMDAVALQQRIISNFECLVFSLFSNPNSRSSIPGVSS